MIYQFVNVLDEFRMMLRQIVLCEGSHRLSTLELIIRVHMKEPAALFVT